MFCTDFTPLCSNCDVLRKWKILQILPFFQAYRSLSENGSYILSLHSLFYSSQWSHNSHCSTYKHNTRTLTGCRLSVQRVYRDLISRTRTVSEIVEVGLMWRMLVACAIVYHRTSIPLLLYHGIRLLLILMKWTARSTFHETLGFQEWIWTRRKSAKRIIFLILF